MIWEIRFEAINGQFDCCIVPAIADNQDEAILKAKRMVPFVRGSINVRAQCLTDDYADTMNDYLRKAYTALCGSLSRVGCNFVSYAEWSAGMEHYRETDKAIREACDAC